MVTDSITTAAISLECDQCHSCCRLSICDVMLQGYGERGIGEVPGGAVLELDVELLSVKTSPFGARVKLVEG